jgi:16S rRNA (adenine1518-N6/adenine1519-N6)-dimethyltransferase
VSDLFQELSPLNVPELLRRYNLRPDKSLGQNFLVDDSALRKVVAAAQIGPADEVLEIGPGLGSLTRYLAASARQVTAVELDENLLPPLREVLAPFDNVRLLQGDILGYKPAEIMEGPGYLVAANIPYYITSALLRHLLEAPLLPQRMILTIQREVAERLVAGPGDLSLLALSVQVYGAPRLAARLPAGAFYPAPKVDSAVVRIDLYDSPAIPVPLLNTFFRLAKAGFSQRRKNLRNSLSAGMRWPASQAETFLQAAGILPQRRAETLSLEEWGRLAAEVERRPPAGE